MNTPTLQTLAQLQPGQCATITNVTGDGALHQRLREMGVMEGIAVEMVRRAPLGDPIEIQIHGYYLSLRKQEAELVKIDDVR